MTRYLKVYIFSGVAIWAICSVIITFYCQCETNTSQRADLIKRSAEDVAKISLPTTFLLVAIMSSPNETERRQVIRDTWLRLSSKTSSVFIPLFPIGTKGIDPELLEKLKEENGRTSDLALIEDLEEAYSNLARKTLKSMIYAFENYKFKYLLKVDSDSFVRLGIFLNALLEVQHPRLYWGFLDGRAKPIRKGKWKETDWILCDRYLPYQLGGGYVLSNELVKYLAVNAPLFKMYKNEDVSVGAWLAGLDVKYIHDPRFDTEWMSRGCNNQYLITHKKSIDEMKKLFQNLKEKKRVIRFRKMLCEQEFRTRYSYVYDWAAVPSKCCERVNGSTIP